MKILYALSFMHGGIAQVWAENETNVVLFHMSTFSHLMELLAGVERTFGDPDWERMACTQLHALKMMMGMTADAHMAKFQMLAGMTGYKVYSQTSLPSGLDNWRTVICNLDHLHRGFSELKQSIHLFKCHPNSNSGHYPYSRHPLPHGH